MKKIIYLLLVFLTIIGTNSCKKKCSNCFQFKQYDNAETGELDILSKQEACGRQERKVYLNEESFDSDNEGSFRTWWECGIYPENEDPYF